MLERVYLLSAFIFACAYFMKLTLFKFHATNEMCIFSRIKNPTQNSLCLKIIRFWKRRIFDYNPTELRLSRIPKSLGRFIEKYLEQQWISQPQRVKMREYQPVSQSVDMHFISNSCEKTLWQLKSRVQMNRLKILFKGETKFDRRVNRLKAFTLNDFFFFLWQNENAR